MPDEPRPSRRFNPNPITEKVVPVVLVLLVLTLLAVLMLTLFSFSA